MRCFLQAAKTRLKKPSDFPLAGSTLYSSHMRACRPAGCELQVKQSTFKKLLRFLQYLDAEKMINLRDGKNDKEPMVISVKREHQKYKDFHPWGARHTEQAAKQEQRAEEDAADLTARARLALVLVRTVYVLKVNFLRIPPSRYVEFLK